MGDQKSFIADTSAVNSVTGWKPGISREEGVRRMVQWCLERG